MTCIVGYVDGKDVYIGADSAGINGFLDRTIRTDEKVFIKGKMIFGFTTSFRMGQIIRYQFTAPSQTISQNDYEFLCSTFIDDLIKAFKDKGYAKVLDNVVKGGTFLLGYKDNLYKIECDFQVGKSVKNYEACGCGESYALGVLYALEKFKMNPVKKIKLALDAAAYFSAGVSKPYKILKLRCEK